MKGVALGQRQSLCAQGKCARNENCSALQPEWNSVEAKVAVGCSEMNHAPAFYETFPGFVIFSARTNSSNSFSFR